MGLSEPFMAGTTTLCFVLSSVTLKIHKSEACFVGFIIASREDSSDKWQLLSGIQALEKPEALPIIYPGFPEGIELPRTGLSNGP